MRTRVTSALPEDSPPVPPAPAEVKKSTAKKKSAIEAPAPLSSFSAETEETP